VVKKKPKVQAERFEPIFLCAPLQNLCEPSGKKKAKGPSRKI
jgi:hypothetical protein